MKIHGYMRVNLFTAFLSIITLGLCTVLVTYWMGVSILAENISGPFENLKGGKEK